MSRQILASVITATLMASAAAPAFADQRSAPQHVEIDISGIDVSTNTGARMVLHRIERAADQICDVRGGLKSLEEIRFEKACIQDTIEKTIKSMADDPVRQAALRAIHEG